MSLLSPRFDISEFINMVKDRSYLEIIQTAEQEVRASERLSSGGVKGARKVRERGAGRYEATLKGLLFLLQSGRKPDGVDPDTFASFRPIIENLVAKDQLKPTALEVFKQE